MLRELLKFKTGKPPATWTHVSRDVRESIADMVGKDANSEPLRGHRHTEFLVWCEKDPPTRLIVWRGSRTLDADEQEAIFLAASRDVAWAAAEASDRDEWKVRLIPLDRARAARDSTAKYRSSGSRSRPTCHLVIICEGARSENASRLPSKSRRELPRRGITEQVEVELVGPCRWVSVHVPRRERDRRAFIGDRRGQAIRLRFATAVAGPIRLGHSSSVGLGLFRPARPSAPGGTAGLRSDGGGKYGRSDLEARWRLAPIFDN